MLERIKNSKAARVCSALVAGVGTALCGAVQSFAAVPTEMKDALTTAFDGVKTDAVSFMSIALPAALGIMGIVIAVSLGIKFFKKFAGK